MQQPVADGAGVHNVGGDDEERYGQKDETVIQAIHENFAYDADVLSPHGQIGERRQEDGIGNRHADSGQNEKRNQAKRKLERHVTSVSFASPVGSWIISS